MPFENVVFAPLNGVVIPSEFFAVFRWLWARTGGGALLRTAYSRVSSRKSPLLVIMVAGKVLWNTAAQPTVCAKHKDFRETDTTRHKSERAFVRMSQGDCRLPTAFGNFNTLGVQGRSRSAVYLSGVPYAAPETKYLEINRWRCLCPEG